MGGRKRAMYCYGGTKEEGERHDSTAWQLGANCGPGRSLAQVFLGTCPPNLCLPFWPVNRLPSADSANLSCFISTKCFVLVFGIFIQFSNIIFKLIFVVYVYLLLILLYFSLFILKRYLCEGVSRSQCHLTSENRTVYFAAEHMRDI